MSFRLLTHTFLVLFAVGFLASCEVASQMLGKKSSVDDLLSSIDSPPTPPVSVTPPVSSTPPVSLSWAQSDVYGGWHSDCINLSGSNFDRIFYSLGTPDIGVAQCSYPTQLDCENFNSGNFLASPNVISGFVWYPNELSTESVSQGTTITTQPGYYFGVKDSNGYFTLFWGNPNSKNKLIGMNANNGPGSPGIFNQGVIDYNLLKTEFSIPLQLDLSTVSQSSFSSQTYVYLVRRNSTSAPASCADSGGL